jgi:hypothetical protein
METQSSGYKKNFFSSHMMMGSMIDTNSMRSKNKHHEFAFNNGDDGDLTEMMVLQKYGGDAVRQQYVEEPSKRGSFLEENNEKELDERRLTVQIALFKMLLSMVALGLMTLSFKIMKMNFRQTLGEDLYGRGIVFFICSIIHYLKQKGIISLFDIRPQIRFSFFFRLLCICLAYLFYFLAIENTSSLQNYTEERKHRTEDVTF